MRAIIIFLCFGMFVFMITHPAAADPSKNQGAAPGSTVELKGAVDNFCTFSERLLLRLGTTRAFIVDIREIGGPSYTMIGVITPYAAAGPLVSGGLLKEIDNPGAYSLTSSVFREKWPMRGDGSLAAAPFLGVLIGKPAAGPSLFFSLDKNNVPRTGFALSLEEKGVISMQSLVSYTELPLDKAPPDSWLLDSPMGAGPDLALLHTALRFRLLTKPFFAGAGFCASMSYGAETGLYGRIHIGFDAKFLKGEGMLFLTDDTYIPLSKTKTDAGFTAAAMVIFTPLRRLSITASYRANLPELPPIPAMYRESSETLELGASIGLFSGALTLSPAYKRSLAYNDLGVGALSQKLSASILLLQRPFSAKITASRNWDFPENKVITNLGALLEIGTQTVDAAVKCGLTLDEEPLFSGGFTLGLAGTKDEKSESGVNGASASLDIQVGNVPLSGAVMESEGSFREFVGKYGTITLRYRVLRTPARKNPAK